MSRFQFHNSIYYNVAKIPEFDLIYRLKQNSECSYLYLSSLNGDIKLYKRSMDRDGHDYTTMIHETMCGGPNFTEFQHWYFLKDIECCDSIADIELNENIARKICYQNCKYLNEDYRMRQNIKDIKIMFKMYLRDLKHYLSANYLKTCMAYYKIFKFEPENKVDINTRNILFQLENSKKLDQYDMINDNPTFMDDIYFLNEVTNNNNNFQEIPYFENAEDKLQATSPTPSSQSSTSSSPSSTSSSPSQASINPHHIVSQQIEIMVFFL